MKQERFRHEVVGSIPEALQPNILYITTDKDVAGHLCACGCGREVITPLSPTDWSISISRQGASLSPSIGNWAFPCRSHYFIWDGAVVWAHGMSHKAIERGRQRDKARKQKYYERQAESSPAPMEVALKPVVQPSIDQSIGRRLLAWWKRLLGR